MTPPNSNHPNHAILALVMLSSALLRPICIKTRPDWPFRVIKGRAVSVVGIADGDGGGRRGKKR